MDDGTVDDYVLNRGEPWIGAAWAAFLACLVASVLTVATPASAAGLGEEPTFFIETIAVEGQRRVTPSIIVAESLLEPGQLYRESELRESVYRIQRLPFVLDAGFALRKGSERGRYELVITIEELRRYFFGTDLIVTRFTNSVSFDTIPGGEWTASLGGLAGIRFFVGNYGVLFGSVSTERGTQLGYTQYNLFGRRAFLSVGLTSAGCCNNRVFSLGIDPTFSNWNSEGDFRETQVTLGLPLGVDQALRLRATHNYSSDGVRSNLLGVDRPRRGLLYEDLLTNELELAWVRDTTDDPIFPREGTLQTLAVDIQSVETEFFAPVNFDFFLQDSVILPPGLMEGDRLPETRNRQIRLSGSVEQTWSLGSRSTVTLSARAAVGQSQVENLPVVEPSPPGSEAPLVLRIIEDEDLDLFEAQVAARYSVSLWGPRKTREKGDLRWETRFEYAYDRAFPDLDLEDNPLHRKTVYTSVVYRNSWGVFRFGFQVADYGA
ncbi:MAG: BamA/TamA family outer membrane protein [Acidobacteriota bacterium]